MVYDDGADDELYLLLVLSHCVSLTFYTMRLAQLIISLALTSFLNESIDLLIL